jgi:hypothetical protein
MKAAQWIALIALGLSSSVAAQSDYTLLVFGDSGTGKDRQTQVASAMAQECQRLGCDAALVLGDLIYRKGVKSIDDPKFQTHFEGPYAGVGPFPFWMAPGNHDHKTEGSVAAQIAYGQSGRSQRWKMPAAHFAVEGLPPWLHIYSLDTEEFAEEVVSDAQAQAARSALCGKPGWRLLMGHHPIHSSGLHGHNAVVGSYLDPVIQECRVQAFFAGHDHHQEHLSTASFEQFIEGAAAKLRRVKRRSDADATQRFARKALGFAIVTFTERTMDVRYFDGTTGNATQIYRCHATVDVPACVGTQTAPP